MHYVSALTLALAGTQEIALILRDPLASKQSVPSLFLWGICISHLGLPEEKERQNSKIENLQETLLTEHITPNRKGIATLSAISDKHKMLTIPKVCKTMTL